ncbi:4,5-DOPA dioxygenase extradiol [Leptospira sp. GIMC2001]|uniref:4,5-DOPA-extradiol-dioxygenase n=1 Tax=Leptospira sp. GIMC2001 TaxID=1513297 RepID=UPI0023497C18|nr:4,5-DOPA dioxygenase extradiol [Leptospira sp. GIMC2001]WCL50189.1 4,5-DOPA dioxygenase extradiol [Leptospira sp. GIMC2001]
MLPAIFFGHGSPMYAIDKNQYSETWVRIGENILSAKNPQPKAILMVSAHWVTKGTSITAMANPKTIHDFQGFPQELFDVQYPAHGDADIAKSIADKFKNYNIQLDSNWGLDHGTWSVLKWAFPEANIPVLQLSINAEMSFLEHYEFGLELSSLRNEGILLMGSGNLVHNLRLLNWGNQNEKLEWAIEASEQFKKLILQADGKNLSLAHKLGEAANLAINSAEHFVPALYCLGFMGKDVDLSKIQLFNDDVNSSISMTGFAYELNGFKGLSDIIY